MGPVLRAAAIYNVVWGGLVVLAPAWTLGVLGLGAEETTDATLAIWRCVGMIVGVYGVGYWAAAGSPLRHWPIVLVGLLGKVLGPIGYVQAAFIEEVIPVSFGLTIITNDLIWWAPFVMILMVARRAHGERR